MIRSYRYEGTALLNFIDGIIKDWPLIDGRSSPFKFKKKNQQEIW